MIINITWVHKEEHNFTIIQQYQEFTGFFKDYFKGNFCLESMTEGDAGLISEMIEIFSTQVIEYGNLMGDYLEREDWQELSKLAHKAKSSVAIMGMTVLAEKLRKLERLAKEEKEVNSFPEFVAFYNTASRNAVTELNDYLTTR